MAPHTPPSILDREGYWGKPTSTLDWCEENYVVSYYIAEFWNTVSNIAIMLPPILAMLYFSKYRHVETRYHVAFATTLLVGIGSWCFHMTLLFEMQLLDELPMIYCGCVMLYCIFLTDGKPNHTNWSLIIIAVLFSSVVTLVYVVIKDPIFHQAAYGTTVILTFIRGVYCTRHLEYSKYLCIYQLAIGAIAFTIWNLDTILCDQLRNVREAVPYPVTVLLQGHFWWHIMSGFGVHLHLMYSMHLRTSYLKCAPQIKHVAGVVPYLTLPGNGNKSHINNGFHTQ